MDAALYVSDFVWVMNKTKYETLSSAQRDVIDAHCNTEWAEKIASPWADFEAAGREKVRNEPGHEVYKISPDDLAAWRKAAEPLTAKWADGVRKAGVDPDKAMAELRATLEQHQAMY
jgi:TRAP-type C4-dicarboxylate transport system substrate-binding protein